MMRERFEELAAVALGARQGEEAATVSYSGEGSDFVRLNQGRVRQAGTVAQAEVTVRLVDGRRHAARSLTLSGEADAARVAAAVADLREMLPHLPEDPHLDIHPEPIQQHAEVGEPVDAVAAVPAVLDMALEDGVPPDLVGFWASGKVARGFASSTGQRSWWAQDVWTLDFCLVADGDKAVKRTVAGFAWDPAVVEEALRTARAERAALSRPVMTIAPGAYRAWLAPSAVGELWGLLGRGLGLQSHKTSTSTLLPLVEGRVSLDPRVNLREHTAAGGAPPFNGDGWPRPDAVELVEKGQLVGSLVSSRSAREYGAACNGADGYESPEALEMDAGDLAEADVLGTLGTGIRVSDLWYTNISDRSSCRVTGMTRFATFWVEDGEIVAPLQVMRFDDEALRLFGGGLVAIGAERPLAPSTSTYFRRGTGSARLPGVLVDGFRLTL
jgi:predicted Zn-dependent protease